MSTFARPATQAALLALALVLLACGSSSAPTPTASGDGAITISSFNFPESELLAEIYAQAIEGADGRVIRRFQLGPREIVDPALQRGLVEFVPEYSGAAISFLGLGRVPAPSEPRAASETLRGILSGTPVEALRPASAQNRNAFAITTTTALRHDLETLSDLRGLNEELVLGGPPECPTRPDCLLGLERAYGLRFAEFLPLDVGGPVTTTALENEVIDVGVVFSSDASYERLDLVELVDDRALQPAENIVPIVRREALGDAGTGLEGVIDGVSAALTIEELRRLNARITLDGRPIDAVASAWLSEQGFADRPA